MDISELVPTERVIEILDPKTDEPLGIRVSLMSISDERLVKLKRKFQDERFKLEARGKTLKGEDLDDNSNDLAFSAMTGWEWYGKDVSFLGQKPAFLKPEVLKVFTKLYWFREQILAAISEERSFFTDSKSA